MYGDKRKGIRDPSVALRIRAIRIRALRKLSPYISRLPRTAQDGCFTRQKLAHSLSGMTYVDCFQFSPLFAADICISSWQTWRYRGLVHEFNGLGYEWVHHGEGNQEDGTLLLHNLVDYRSWHLVVEKFGTEN
jgi:hypothetical protein